MTLHRGETSATLVGVLLFASMLLIVGVAVGFGLSAPASGRGATFLLNALSAPGCYVPLAFLVGTTTLAAGVGLYYGKQRLDAQVRVWQAQAAAEEADVERLQAQINDLTPGPDGEEVARMLEIDGRRVLVNPRLGTSPVTAVELESAVRPNQVPDDVTLGALLASAMKRMGGGRLATGQGRGSPLDGMALWMAARGMPTLDQHRIPPTIRVLDAEEIESLEEGKE